METFTITTTTFSEKIQAENLLQAIKIFHDLHPGVTILETHYDFAQTPSQLYCVNCFIS